MQIFELHNMMALLLYYTSILV